MRPRVGKDRSGERVIRREGVSEDKQDGDCEPCADHDHADDEGQKIIYEYSGQATLVGKNAYGPEAERLKTAHPAVRKQKSKPKLNPERRIMAQENLRLPLTSVFWKNFCIITRPFN